MKSLNVKSNDIRWQQLWTWGPALDPFSSLRKWKMKGTMWLDTDRSLKSSPTQDWLRTRNSIYRLAMSMNRDSPRWADFKKSPSVQRRPMRTPGWSSFRTLNWDLKWMGSQLSWLTRFWSSTVSLSSGWRVIISRKRMNLDQNLKWLPSLF